MSRPELASPMQILNRRRSYSGVQTFLVTFHLLGRPISWCRESNSPMPMIDVYAREDFFPPGTDRQLGEQLTFAVLRAEGVKNPGPFHLNNTAAYIHRMDPKGVHTAAENSPRTVRVQVITPPGALSRDGQKQLVREITDIVTKISGDPTQASRTWVLLTEAAEGGWGLAGTAFGKEEFAALAAKATAARAAGSS